MIWKPRPKRPSRLRAVLVDVDVDPGDAGLHRGLGHGRRHSSQGARVELLRHDVERSEAERLQSVGAQDDVGHVLAGQLGQGAGGRELHRLVDLASPDVQGATEDVREAHRVVDLVRVVRAAGRDDRVRAGLDRQLVLDLRVRVGEQHQDRLVRHDAEHLLADAVGDRDAHEDVGVAHRVELRLRASVSTAYRSFQRFMPLVRPW